MSKNKNRSQNWDVDAPLEVFRYTSDRIELLLNRLEGILGKEGIEDKLDLDDPEEAREDLRDVREIYKRFRRGVEPWETRTNETPLKELEYLVRRSRDLIDRADIVIAESATDQLGGIDKGKAESFLRQIDLSITKLSDFLPLTEPRCLHPSCPHQKRIDKEKTAPYPDEDEDDELF